MASIYPNLPCLSKTMRTHHAEKKWALAHLYENFNPIIALSFETISSKKR